MKRKTYVWLIIIFGALFLLNLYTIDIGWIGGFLLGIIFFIVLLNIFTKKEED